MNLTNYGITQNNQVRLSDVLGNEPINDFMLYEEMGLRECKLGNREKGIKWFYKGLHLAKDLKNNVMLKKFEGLIYSSI